MKDKKIMSISVALIALSVGVAANFLSGMLFNWIKLNNDYLESSLAIIGIFSTIISLVIVLQHEAKRPKDGAKKKNTDGESKNG